MKSSLAALTVWLVACQPDRPADTSHPPAADVRLGREPAADTLSVVDSVGNVVGVARFRPSTKAAFDQLRATDPLPPRPTDALSAADAPLPTDGRVRRQGELLLLQPEQGPVVTLQPTPSPDGPVGNDNAYFYWGTLPSIRQWVVDVSPDEGSAVLLIDQRTGQRTQLLGYPTVSPDGRFLLSVCEDMASGAGVTNLTLYKCGRTVQPVWTRDLTEWGPRRARWRDNRHIIIAQAHSSPDGNVLASTKSPLTYIELELPRLR